MSDSKSGNGAGRVNVSIGILARNATKTIGATLRSLFAQSIVAAPPQGWNVEILLIANACTDDTVPAARALFAELAKKTGPAISWRVDDVAQGGKSNAWNLFVHERSKPETDFFVLLDADIEFIEEATLANMVKALIDDPEATICTDRPVKDTVKKGKKSLKERLSNSTTKEHKGTEVYICGQCYAGRATSLRKIWMPVGLPTEDSFLWQMVVTDRYTTAPVHRRVIRADHASHYFEAVTNPAELLRHEKRVVAGICINVLLHEYFEKECVNGVDAGSLIKRRNDAESQWLKSFLKEKTRDRKWLVPGPLMTRRFNVMKGASLPKKLAFLPYSLAVSSVDFVVFAQANHLLLHGNAYGYW